MGYSFSLYHIYSSPAPAAVLILPSSFPCLQHQEPNKLLNSVRTNYINLSGMARYAYYMINYDVHVTTNPDRYNNSELF